MAGECVVRNNFKNKNEYAKISINNKTKLAYRYFYELKFGKIPEGKVCDHLCKNPHCINLDHIEIVTQGENTRRGKSAKLTWDDVINIRLLYKNKAMIQIEIAEMYGVGQDEISRIVNKRRWS